MRCAASRQPRVRALSSSALSGEPCPANSTGIGRDAVMAGSEAGYSPMCGRHGAGASGASLRQWDTVWHRRLTFVTPQTRSRLLDSGRPTSGSAMKTLFKWLFRLVVLVLVLAGAFVVHVWYFKPYKIDWFYTRAFAQFALDSPEMLSNMRILPSWADFYSSKLDDASPEHEQVMADRVRDDHDTLLKYDRSKMDKRGQLSYDILEYF